MDALSQFKNMSPEPKLWDGFDTQNDNKSYLDESMDFWQAKQELKDSLFWNFVIPEDKDNTLLSNKLEYEEYKEEDFDWSDNSFPSSSNSKDPLEVTKVETEETPFELTNDFDLIEDSLVVENEIEEPFELTNDFEDLELDEKEIQSDSPYFPILKSLSNSWYVDSKVFLETTESLNNSNREDWQNELTKIVKDIPNNQLSSEILEKFNDNEPTTEDNFENSEFAKDLSELNFDLDSWIGGLELMMADSYISIPNIDWTENKQIDILSAMDVSANTMITNNSIDFKNENAALIWDIRLENNIEKKYSLLKDLFKQDLAKDAEFAWWAKIRHEQRIKKQTLMQKAEKITAEIVDLKLNKDLEDSNKMEKLTEKREKIINEANLLDKNVSEIQMLAGWDLDKSNEWELFEKERQVA